MKNRVVLFILMLAIVLSGIFCIQGFQMMNSHCESAGESTLCGSFLDHGTIIQSAILSIIFTLVVVISVVFLSPSQLLQNFKYIINKYKYLFLRIKESFLILKPLESSFSKGVLHLRKP